jgi:hypothetical protein
MRRLLSGCLVLVTSCIPKAPEPKGSPNLEAWLTADGTGASRLDLCLGRTGTFALGGWCEAASWEVTAVGPDGAIALRSVPAYNGNDLEAWLADADATTVAIDWQPSDGGSARADLVLPSAPRIITPADGATMSLAAIGPALHVSWAPDPVIAPGERLAYRVGIQCRQHGAEIGDELAADRTDVEVPVSSLPIGDETCEGSIEIIRSRDGAPSVSAADLPITGRTWTQQTRRVTFTLTP